MADETTTSIAEYRPVEVALARLREQYGATQWVCDTPERLAGAKQARKEIRDWRLALEAERKKIKAPALAKCHAIDAEAKRICAAILEVEQPVADAIKEVEDAKRREREEAERAEAERIDRCRNEIDRIRAIPVPLTAAPVAELERAMDELKALDLEWLEEFEAIGQSARQTTMATLGTMRDAAAEREAETKRLAEERAELERLRAEETRRAEEEDEKRRAAIEAEEQEARRRRAELDRQEHEARARIAEEERAAREAREKADAEARALRAKQEEEARKARKAEEARQREERERLEKERQEAEERKRVERMRRQHRLDARELLQTFVGQYGELEEFADVVIAIKGYFDNATEEAA